MTYKLFLDDERDPIGDDWIVVRSYDEAVNIIHTMGMPELISFDHDLGYDQKTGYDFAKFLVEFDLDNDVWKSIDSFNIYVHSQNPIGKKNIEMLFGNYFLRKFDSNEN